MDTVTKSVVSRGWEKRGMNRQNTEFWDSENIGYDTIKTDTCPVDLSKPIEYITLNVSPGIKCGL